MALASNSIKCGEIEVTAVAVDALVADYLKVPRLSGTVGGTLADLLPGQPPADIRLSVDGTVADMTGNGTVLMEGNAVTGFTLANRLSDEGSAFELKGDGEFARFAPPTLQQLLDGKTTFDLAGTISKTGTVRGSIAPTLPMAHLQQGPPVRSILRVPSICLSSSAVAPVACRFPSGQKKARSILRLAPPRSARSEMPTRPNWTSLQTSRRSPRTTFN